ncbi:MAG: NAD-dependent deacylase [Chloroflexi bacterium]|nr:NAD-dependent deacylase [Chloroflexota bacterium]
MLTAHAPSPETEYRQAARRLREARHAVALTGAGISTPSGIPDFRSPGSGLWENTDPMEVASLPAFRYHPGRFYRWLRPLAAQVASAQPNPAHLALAQLEAAGRLQMVITQNIDDLHTRAGSHRVLEVHGNLREATCVHCYTVLPGAPLLAQFLADGEVPLCPACGGVMKPNVILYGEQLVASIVREAETATRLADLMLVAGSSLEVVPAAALPLEVLKHGGNVIVINHTPTYVDERAAVVIREDVAIALPRLVAEVLDGRPG